MLSTDTESINIVSLLRDFLFVNLWRWIKMTSQLHNVLCNFLPDCWLKNTERHIQAKETITRISSCGSEILKFKWVNYLLSKKEYHQLYDTIFVVAYDML